MGVGKKEREKSEHCKRAAFHSAYDIAKLGAVYIAKLGAV
jgi:hypothetical protein